MESSLSINSFKKNNFSVKYIFLLAVFCLNLVTINKDICFAKYLKNSRINEIFVVSNGWHTGIVIPSGKILKTIPALSERFDDSPYIEFGWGDEGFYQSNDFSLGIAISAIFWPTDSVMHAVAVPIDVERYFSNSDIEKICLRNERFSELINFISNSFFVDKGGNLEKLNKGLYGNSQFYRSVLDFHLMNTCNTWTANGLKSVGLEIFPKNKITADSVMNYIKQAKNNLDTKYRINCKNRKN